MANNFNIKEQIEWQARVEGEVVGKFTSVVAGGMGGSALAPRALFYLDPEYPIWLHNDYEFPEKHDDGALFVALSYSGNTGETLSFAQNVLDKGLPLAVVTSGGKLLDMAKEKGLPHVVVPGGNQPRDSVVYMLKALLTILKKSGLLKEIDGVALDVGAVEAAAKSKANEFGSKIPLIYTSRQNSVLGYMWKIVLNETAKVPAFSNYFPELTHNEMQGIAGSDKVKAILLKDRSDNPGVKNEMAVFEQNALKHGMDIFAMELQGTMVEKLIKTLVESRAIAHELAAMRGVDPDSVPFIEEFKKEL